MLETFHAAAKLLDIFGVQDRYNAFIALAFVKWLSFEAADNREHWESSDVLAEIANFQNRYARDYGEEVAASVAGFLKTSLHFNSNETSDLPFAALMKLLKGGKQDIAALILNEELTEKADRDLRGLSLNASKFLLDVLELGAAKKDRLKLVYKAATGLIEAATNKANPRDITLYYPRELSCNQNALALAAIRTLVGTRAISLEWQLPKEKGIAKNDLLLIDISSLFNEFPMVSRENNAISRIATMMNVLNLTTLAKRTVILLSPHAKKSEPFKTWVQGAFAEGSIEAVVELPSGTCIHTAMAPTMVVISGNNKNVTFIDATKLEEKNGRAYDLSESSAQSILKALSSKSSGLPGGVKSDSAITISIENIINADFSLDPSYYLIMADSAEGKISLDATAAVFRGGSARRAPKKIEDGAEKTVHKHLLTKDLKGRQIDINALDCLSAAPETTPRNFLTKGDILLPVHGSPFGIGKHIGIVGDIPEGVDIFPSGNVYVVRFDPEKINPTFAMAYLSSAEGRAQLEDIYRCESNTHRSVDLLRCIQLPQLLMKEQDAIAKRYREAMEDIERAEATLTSAKRRLEDLFEELDADASTNNPIDYEPNE